MPSFFRDSSGSLIVKRLGAALLVLPLVVVAAAFLVYLVVHVLAPTSAPAAIVVCFVMLGLLAGMASVAYKRFVVGYEEVADVSGGA